MDYNRMFSDLTTVFVVVVLGAVCALTVVALLPNRESPQETDRMSCLTKQGVFVEAKNGWVCVRPEALINMGEQHV